MAQKNFIMLYDSFLVPFINGLFVLGFLGFGVALYWLGVRLGLDRRFPELFNE